MIEHVAFFAGDTLGNLDQLKLHPRTDLIQFHRPLLPSFIIPADVVVRKVHSISIVSRDAGRRRRCALVAVARGARLTLFPEEEVRDVLLVAEVEHPSLGMRLCGLLGGRALENTPDTFRDAVRLDGDKVVSEVDGTTVCVVGDEDDAASGGEGERVRRERGKEGLEALHHEREVRGCGGRGRRE